MHLHEVTLPEMVTACGPWEWIRDHPVAAEMITCNRHAPLITATLRWYFRIAPLGVQAKL